MKKLNQLEKDLLKAVKKHQPSYFQLTNAMKTVYQQGYELNIFEKPKKKRKLPHIPCDQQIIDLIREIDKMENITYKLWLYLLYTTGIRVGELVNIKKPDVNIEKRCIRIPTEKNEDDRYVLILSDIVDLLKAYMTLSNQNKLFLFEHKGQPYGVRQVQKVVKESRENAGIAIKITPHTMRHLFLTALAEDGWSDAEKQLLSGHRNRESLQIYEHLSVEKRRDQYENTIGQKFRKINGFAG